MLRILPYKRFYDLVHEGVFQATAQCYQHTNLEQDKDEEQLVDDTDTKPKPPVSYRERKIGISDTFKIKEYIKIDSYKFFI